MAAGQALTRANQTDAVEWDVDAAGILGLVRRE